MKLLVFCHYSVDNVDEEESFLRESAQMSERDDSRGELAPIMGWEKDQAGKVYGYGLVLKEFTLFGIGHQVQEGGKSRLAEVALADDKLYANAEKKKSAKGAEGQGGGGAHNAVFLKSPSGVKYTFYKRTGSGGGADAFKTLSFRTSSAATVRQFFEKVFQVDGCKWSEEGPTRQVSVPLDGGKSLIFTQEEGQQVGEGEMDRLALIVDTLSMEGISERSAEAADLCTVVTSMRKQELLPKGIVTFLVIKIVNNIQFTIFNKQ